MGLIHICDELLQKRVGKALLYGRGVKFLLLHSPVEPMCSEGLCEDTIMKGTAKSGHATPFYLAPVPVTDVHETTQAKTSI